jgi:hypothetical protein
MCHVCKHFTPRPIKGQTDTAPTTKPKHYKGTALIAGCSLSGHTITLEFNSLADMPKIPISSHVAVTLRKVPTK